MSSFKMKLDLSEGVILPIMKNEEILDPILQIIGFKLIQENSDKHRYRLVLSDGKFSSGTVVFVADPTIQIEEFSVVKLKEYRMTSIPSGTKILVVLNLETLLSGSLVGGRIGNPEVFNEEMLKENAQVTPSAESKSKKITPIEGLNPYGKKWMIKARVTNKSEMKNSRRPGSNIKVFNFDLIDSSGEIRCVAFNNVAEKFFNAVEVDKVYYLSNCHVISAKKNFNSLKHEYEIKMCERSVVQQTNDIEDIPQVKYNFTNLSDVIKMDVNTIIDVIAVCLNSSELQNVTSRRTNEDLHKCDVVLVDQSETTINLTLWGAQAENFNGSEHPVLLLRGVRIGEFGGAKQLSIGMNSHLKVDPDNEGSKELKEWFSTRGQYCSFTQQKRVPARWINLQEIQNLDGLQYFRTSATILIVISENAVYKACPFNDCNKKVIELDNRMYRCDRCEKEYPNFKYSLLLRMLIADFSGSHWVTVFSATAEKILNKTAQEVGLAMENEHHSDATISLFQEAAFKTFIFTCRAKMDTYNDEQRLKVIVWDVEHIRNGASALCNNIAELIS